MGVLFRVLVVLLLLLLVSPKETPCPSRPSSLIRFPSFTPLVPANDRSVLRNGDGDDFNDELVLFLCVSLSFSLSLSLSLSLSVLRLPYVLGAIVHRADFLHLLAGFSLQVAHYTGTCFLSAIFQMDTDRSIRPFACCLCIERIYH